MKRFTETQKWEDPWFRRLSPAAKLLWDWLTCKCDPAGVIDFDAEFATFQIGLPISDKNVTELGDRVSRLKNGKLLINRFVEFQYGTLSDACPAHKPIFKALTAHGLKHPPDTLSNRLSTRVCNTLQEKEKEKEMDSSGEGGVGEEEPLPLPAGFPKTDKQAVEMSQKAGCPAPDAYIADIWLQARGRGGIDGANVQIRHFGSYAKKRWGREEMKWKAEQKANSSGTPQYDVAAPGDEPELSPWEILQARLQAQEEAENANQRP